MTRYLIGATAALLIVGTSGYAGWHWRGAEVAELKRQHAQALADATAATLRDQSRITHRIQEAQDAEHLKRQEAESAARRAVAATVSLRDELAALRAHVEGRNWSLADCRASASSTISVLSDMLGQCADRRRELAQYADEASSAGRLCERAADAVRSK